MKTMIALMLLLSSAPCLIAQQGWEAIQIRGRENRTVTLAEQELWRLSDQILSVMKKAGPLNPPRGFYLIPLVRTDPGTELPGGIPGLASLTVDIGFVFSLPMEDLVMAGVRVRINDPMELLGEPFFADRHGKMYLLPPAIDGPGGQKLLLRTAHPAGYPETCPESGIMPLWHQDSTPWYRSLLRPHFSLSSSRWITMFTRDGRTWWKSVARERWIQGLIDHAGGELSDIRTGAHVFAVTDLTEQQAERIRRYTAAMKEIYSLEAIIKQYEMMLQMAEISRGISLALGKEPSEEEYRKDLAKAEEYREEMLKLAPEAIAGFEEQEQQLIAALYARDEEAQSIFRAIDEGDWDLLEKIGRNTGASRIVMLADVGRHREALAAELASMSQAERRSEAWGFEVPEHVPSGAHRVFMAQAFSLQHPSGLLEPGTPGSRAIVELDDVFFEARPSDAQPLILTVCYYIATLKGGEPYRILESRGKRAPDPGSMMLTDIWKTLGLAEPQEYRWTAGSVRGGDGFSVIDYYQVYPNLGSWEDV